MKAINLFLCTVIVLLILEFGFIVTFCDSPVAEALRTLILASLSGILSIYAAVRFYYWFKSHSK